MAIASFYHAQLNSSESSIELSAEEGAHAVKARRLRVESEVRLFNGEGLVGDAIITAVERNKVSVNVLSLRQCAKPKTTFSIAMALPKGDRQKVMLDMLTQLGVSEIIPLRCERSVTQFSSKMADKWRRVMIGACKQSQNPWLPKLSDEVNFLELLHDSARQLVYADVNGEKSERVFREGPNPTILIGPEGGFSNIEFNALSEMGVLKLALGGHILRTEAAAVSAAAQFNAYIES